MCLARPDFAGHTSPSKKIIRITLNWVRYRVTASLEEVCALWVLFVIEMHPLMFVMIHELRPPAFIPTGSAGT